MQTTVTSHFSKYTPRDTILAVREGAPVADALNCASMFLCAALATLREREGDDFMWGVEHMIETAKALIDAVPMAREV